MFFKELFSVFTSDRPIDSASKDFARADELRDQIIAAGFRIEDTPDGTKVRTS